jgi:lipopolysaccharide heptosyltransferase I
MNVLIVRLGSLGDIIHALPVAAALAERFPAARIDWLVDARYRIILDYVPVVSRRLVVNTSRAWACRPSETARETRIFAGRRALGAAVAELRRGRYDVAYDLQGLLKSALLARLSGARRVVGFPAHHLRERAARVFYTETVDPAGARHVVDKNLAALAAVGISGAPRRFPLDVPPSPIDEDVRRRLGLPGSGRFALINPGAAWPNKQWPADRFGAVAAAVWARHGVRSAVLWGPGEESLARAVEVSSGGAAAAAPPTSVADLVRLSRAACLMVAGDTGPMHIAAAAGAPIVALFGPTDPERNGPWDPADITLSRYEACVCHYQRRCRREIPCLADISVEDLVAAIDRRLAPSVPRG